MMRSRNTDIAARERGARVQQLLSERRQLHPEETCEQNFMAVANSPEGEKLFAGMQHFANSGDVPIQSPRHAALLGRTFPIPDAEFRTLWISKFGEPGSGVGYGSPYPGYPSEQEERRQTAKAAGGSFQGDVDLKEKGRAGFLAEVSRLMALGRNYEAAWAEASSTNPGREFYAQWASGAAQVKGGA